VRAATIVPFMTSPPVRAEFSPTHCGDSIRYDPANAEVDADSRPQARSR
jgi:hypothetical protein